MEELNIIGDIAGQKKALDALLDKMPKCKVVLLGDLNDRGPHSKEVVEWAMTTPDVTTLHSNHGDMFVDFMKKIRGTSDRFSRYTYTDFLNNGGNATLLSYTSDLSKEAFVEGLKAIPNSHVEFLNNLPVYFIVDGLYCSHAPDGPWIKDRMDAVWNRDEPTYREGILQVFGHNAHWGLKWFGDWAVCLDTSREKVLTGMHWPSREIFQQKYL